MTVGKKTKRRGKKEKGPSGLNFELTCFSFNFVLFKFLFNVDFLRKDQ